MNFQESFHRRWGHLRDPHVRALAWLLDAPDLLDADAPAWQGRIASLPQVDAAAGVWLSELDGAPQDLHAWLDLHPFTRLGRYAESLLAFYLRRTGDLVAHGLQVRPEKGATIGEFDFLLRRDGVLVHWEFASKFYLLESDGEEAAVSGADRFVGPNLADTLGAKVRKIMERQLALSQHPAAQVLLPEPVARAQALVKGWLFYRGSTPQPPASTGIAPLHCHGFWRTLPAFDGLGADAYAILPRLRWLAPARLPAHEGIDLPALRERLAHHFQNDDAPVMIAALGCRGDLLLESDRGFIVPADWPERAGDRIVRMAGK
jgi:hypothetical protein